MLDLKTYSYPELSAVDMAFSVLATDPVLLQEAKDRNFYLGRTPFNKLFGHLFFNGGQLNFRQDIPLDFQAKASRYLLALMRSFSPKHEEKEAVCAMLLSELVVVEPEGQ